MTAEQATKRDVTTKQKERKKGTKDLLQLASKIEVLSYLSPEAVAEILDYVEYVDLSSDPVGKVIFDNNTLDGSLYAVVSGEVTMSLSVQKRDHNNKVEDESHSFSFVASQGEVMTSMLTLISSLIREYQLQEAFISSPIPGLIGSEFISVDINGRPTVSSEKRSVIPDGICVNAVISAPNTCLMRIPSRCFVNILDHFPKDVHQICQTIVARLQRVTIQSLVRFLGLEDEVLGTGGKGYHDKVTPLTGKIPERKPRKTPEWKKFEQAVASDTSVNVSLLDHAIPAAASLLGLSPEQSKLLKDGASIVSFPPGSTLCIPGEALGAVYLIIKGSLEVSYEKNGNRGASTASHRLENHSIARRRESVRSEGAPTPLFSAGSGTFVGLFSSFTNDSSFINAQNPASGDNALLLRISSQTFEKIVSSYPRALIHCLLDILDTIGNAPSVFLLGKSSCMLRHDIFWDTLIFV